MYIIAGSLNIIAACVIVGRTHTHGSLTLLRGSHAFRL